MEQKKKNGGPYWITLVLSLILLLCSCSKQKKPVYSGDHHTVNIRGMWQICYFSMKKSNPFGPDPFHWGMCDCIVDESRKTYKNSDYENIDSESLTRFFQEATGKCALRIKSGKVGEGIEIPQMRTM